MHLKEMHVKYPRTPHLPWSLGASKDDRILPNTDHFRGRRVVITEKMDGENTTLYPDHLHARSLDSKDHWSRHWLKAFHAGIRGDIPKGWRVCGENLYATHSIEYQDLPAYFLAFSVWEGSLCLDWQTTEDTCEIIGLHLVPVLWKGVFDEKMLIDLAGSLDPERVEGYVVRLEESFQMEDFSRSVAKFVREGHVQTDEHWMHKATRETNGVRV